MEVEQDNSDSVGTVDNLEQNKDAETVNSSEDEGIFISHNPQGISVNSDTENTIPVSNSEVNSDNQKPSDVVGGATKSGTSTSDDSEDEAISKNRSFGRRHAAVLSDDDDDSIYPQPVASNHPSLSSNEEESNDGILDKKKKKKRIVQRIDSDSDDDLDLFQGKDNPSHLSSERPKPLSRYNSDLFDAELSSDEDKPKPFGDPDASPPPPRDSDCELKPAKGKKGKLNFDAELTSDEDQPKAFGYPSGSPPPPRDSDDELNINPAKNKKEKVAKHRPPSYKEKEKEVREIHSETQRMVRDSQVSLPYHRPKQRTLTEFLNRRKKTTPPQRTMRGSLKMSMRNMETLRLLEEKKKEVEEFFKSDSDQDQEDPDDKDWTPGCEEELEKPSLGKGLVDLEEKVTNFESNLMDKKTSPMDVDIKEMDLGSKKNDLETTRTDMETKETHLDSEMEVDKVVNDPVLDILTSDELPDISNTSGVKTTRDSEASTLETVADHALAVPGNKEQLVPREAQSVDPCEKINDSGIHSGVSSPSDQAILGEAVAELEKDTIVPPELRKSEVNDEKMETGLINSVDTEEEETMKENIMPENIDRKSLCQTVESADLAATSSALSENTKSETPKLSLLASRLPDLDKIIMETPRLSLGRESDFIDLEEEENTTPKNPSGMIELMDRFVKHSNTKRKPAKKHQVNLSIVSKEKDSKGADQLVSSNLVVTVDSEEEDQPRDTVPGARLVSLKTALKAKIREQRERERQRRVKEKQFIETEQVIEDYYDDGALPDEEAELTDQSETDYETESEPEENDIVLTDKKRKKNAYFDDEAEEDDDIDEGDVNDDKEEEEEEDDKANIDDSVSLTAAAEDGDSNDTVEMFSTRRRIEGCEDETEDANDNEHLNLRWEDSQDVRTLTQAQSSLSTISRSNTEELFASQSSCRKDGTEKDTSTTSMDSSFELFGSVIPGHQPGGGTRHGGGRQPSESDHDTSNFLTPFVKAKSGNSSSSSKERDLSLPIEDTQDLFNTAPASSRSLQSPNELSLHLTPLEDSQFPTKEADKPVNPVAKLRLDFTDITGTQEKDLVGLCSGQFTGKTSTDQEKDLYEDDLTPTQDINELMGLCSGQFSGRGGNPGQGSSTLGDNPHQDHQSDDNDELLNLCTAKFTTQPIQEDSISAETETEKTQDAVKDFLLEEDSTPAPKMIVFSSDEEDDDARRMARIKRRRKKRKRIVEFSDDEDAQDAIEFDDEENEIPRISFTGFKDKEKGGIRADFLENEAELSGSDLNSEDEDEAGYDDMEEEDGDRELYDENELRDQVGRVHLKTLMDSDQRQLRLLQEMYLEDGEMHGEGRQRQFRWRNVDNDEEDDGKKVLSDNEEGGEEELEDTEWRKEKIEREKFLQEQKAKLEDQTTEMFKLGRKPIVRTSSVVADATTKREPLKAANPAPGPIVLPQTKISPHNSFSKLSKRGSFLSRDKCTLARIAELTREKGNVVGGAKQAGNFVFQQLSAEEVQEKMDTTRVKRTQSLPSNKRYKLDRSFHSLDSSNQSNSIFKYF